MNCKRVVCRMLAAAVAAALTGLTAMAQEDLFERAPWSGSLQLGYTRYEGDEQIENGYGVVVRLGYDFNAWWSAEAGFDVYPQLKARAFDDPRREPLEDDPWALRLVGEVMLHLRNARDLHWDPYLALGVGGIYYSEELEDGSTDWAVLAGGGLMYHFNDEWAVRADARTMLVGPDTEANLLAAVGVNWRWGARRPALFAVAGGDIDSDGDGLLDSREAELGTDPYDPDTDKDGLTDGQEVLTYKTDPLNPDTDWDGLKDGAEVLTYSTDPLNRDTDAGGVADGHEVIEDHTNPLDPSDDLQLFTLNIEFDYDKADLRPEYFDELDVIVKVLQRDPGATARIEGHADKRPTSGYEYNIRLSERRAKAVVDYIADVGGIERSRLTWKGYGYTRPVAPNDTEENMQKNRRTEIYIRPSHQQPGPAESTQEPEAAAAPETPAAP